MCVGQPLIVAASGNHPLPECVTALVNHDTSAATQSGRKQGRNDVWYREEEEIYQGVSEYSNTVEQRMIPRDSNNKADWHTVDLEIFVL